MKCRLRAPSPAFVVSLLALFVALGGTTYAATNLPKNSVGTKQLKKNAVTAAKIKNGAVTAAKINSKGLTVPDALHATNTDSATNAVNATHATSATSATNAVNAANAANATHAASATNAMNATTATNAVHATTATEAENGAFGTFPLSGFAGPDIPGSSTSYVFVGPTVTATTTPGQWLVGAAEAPLGSSGGTAIRFGLCYQPAVGGAITNFVGSHNYSVGVVPAGSSDQPFPATAAVNPGAGTWTVGYCIWNSGPNALDDNDFVNGWIQVVGTLPG